MLTRRKRLLLAVFGLILIKTGAAAPYVPHDDTQVLAEVPPGAAHVAAPAWQLARSRLDVALPLAQFYITRSRSSGDLRYLGYAEATLSPWLTRSDVPPEALVLQATIQQSRHLFAMSLVELDRALAAQPDNAQAWLTRATVLRVLGRYAEAMGSCDRLSKTADAAVTTLCNESLRGLTGHLRSAYDTLIAMPAEFLPEAARAWRYSELGEMAERLGLDAEAEHWFTEGLRRAGDDSYMRTRFGDLLLRTGRNAEVLQLLGAYRSMEPMLVRIAIAEQRLGVNRESQTVPILATAFAVEEQRGDPVHRREQALFLLDVMHQPGKALAAARENWDAQREPEDALILERSAQAAGRPEWAAPADEFLRAQKLEDVRVHPYTVRMQ